MAKKQKPRDPRFAIFLKDFIESLQGAMLCFEQLDELLNDHCDCEAYIDTLQAIHKTVGAVDLEDFIRVLNDANDADMRCPK